MNYTILDVPFATILLTYGAIGFINGVILVLVFDVYYGTSEVMGSFPTSLYEWFVIMSIGLLTYVGPASLTIGLQIEMAGLLSLMRKAFAIIFSYTFPNLDMECIKHYFYVLCSVIMRKLRS